MTDQFDLRQLDVDLDGALQAIQDEYVRSGRYPDGLVISSEQELAFLAEWRASGVEEPAPEALDGGWLWGQRVTGR